MSNLNAASLFPRTVATPSTSHSAPSILPRDWNAEVHKVPVICNGSGVGHSDEEEFDHPRAAPIPSQVSTLLGLFPRPHVQTLAGREIGCFCDQQRPVLAAQCWPRCQSPRPSPHA